VKIILTGANGQLGRALQQSLSGHELIPTTSNILNITDQAGVQEFIRRHQPDLVINTAAYTQVDAAESDIEMAYLVNKFGPAFLSRAAAEQGAAILHVSTDYVFDGHSKPSWVESDETAPLSVYGKSKLAGEFAVQETNPRCFIVRTAWLYHYSGQNFLRTMYRLSGRPEVRVVDDQRGSPTNADDLATAIGQLIETEAYGIHHLANQGDASWYELTCEFYRQLGITTPVIPVNTTEFPRPAPRPACSILATERQTGIELPDWQVGVAKLVEQIRSSGWPD
jgi:dTDP-4-dehydrorhamnose reductase